MNNYESINWNGMTLEITARPDFLLSRLTKKDHVILKVTDAAHNILMHDSFAATVIEAAGGNADFVDVMLSAQLAA